MPIQSAKIAIIFLVLFFSSCVEPNRKEPLSSINRIAANADTYQTYGNIELTVNEAQGVLANDEAKLPVTSFDQTSSNGGTVSMSPDGSFVYIPPPGFQGTDQFEYRVNIGPDNQYFGIVSIVISEMTWFVDNSVSSNGIGTLGYPFNNLKSVEAVSQPGDTIYVAFGTGDARGQNQGIFLKDDQKLIGSGVDLVIDNQVIIPTSSAGLSLITNTSGTGNGIDLANNNEIRGIAIDGTAGYGISGNTITNAKISDVQISNTTLSGIIMGEVSGDIEITDSSITSSQSIGVDLIANTTTSAPVVTDNIFASNQMSDVQLVTLGTARMDPYIARNTSSNNLGVAAYLFTVGDSSIQIGTVSTNVSNNSAGDGIRVLASGSFSQTQYSFAFNRMSVSQGHGFYALANSNARVQLTMGSEQYLYSRLNAVNLATNNTAQMTVNLTSSYLNNSSQVGLQAIASGSSLMTQRIISNEIKDNTFIGGIISAGGNAVINTLVRTNTLSGNNLASTTQGSFQVISVQNSQSAVCLELVSNSAGKFFDTYRGTGTGFFIYNDGQNTPSVSLRGGLGGPPVATGSGQCVP